MANPTVFCNTPWYEAHIYWDGSLGICCQESRKLHSNDQTYNIRNMTLSEWFNSEPVRQFRKDMLRNTPTDICSRCHHEESHNGTSRRHRSNQKSVIFTKQAFIKSFEQSPGYKHFMFSQDKDGITNTMPIDLHIDLGNHCNLACKMCWSGASTRIASQFVKWGYADHQQYLGVDWTKDSEVWMRFLNELITIPKLKNIHLMGGETLLSPRFEQLVDFMILHQRFDISFSFVTNGTVYRPDLIAKLKQFARIGIEISIETTTSHNDYVRQGSKIEEILGNISKYQQLCNAGNMSLTIRTAISLLTVGYYHTLLKYCLSNRLIIKSLLVTDPIYLDCKLLPNNIKDAYKQPYEEMLLELGEAVDVDFNESDPNQYKKSIKLQLIQVLNLLNDQKYSNNQLLEQTVRWCQSWDKVYGFNARELYPEFIEIFDQYGY